MNARSHMFIPKGEEPCFQHSSRILRFSEQCGAASFNRKNQFRALAMPGASNKGTIEDIEHVGFIDAGESRISILFRKLAWGRGLAIRIPGTFH